MSKTRTTVYLEEPTYSQFKDLYPMRGATKWFFNTVLRAFVEAHSSNEPPSPEKVAKALKESL